MARRRQTSWPHVASAAALGLACSCGDGDPGDLLGGHGSSYYSNSHSSGGSADQCLGSEPLKCASGSDCPSGYRCNSQAPSPQCQKIRCAPAGSPCDSHDICADGLFCESSASPCQQHMCVAPGSAQSRPGDSDMNPNCTCDSDCARNTDGTPSHCYNQGINYQGGVTSPGYCSNF